MNKSESRIAAFIDSLPPSSDTGKIDASLLTAELLQVGGTTKNGGNCVNTTVEGCKKSTNNGDCQNAENCCNGSSNGGDCIMFRTEPKPINSAVGGC